MAARFINLSTELISPAFNVIMLTVHLCIVFSINELTEYDVVEWLDKPRPRFDSIISGEVEFYAKLHVRYAMIHLKLIYRCTLKSMHTIFNNKPPKA